MVEEGESPPAVELGGVQTPDNTATSLAFGAATMNDQVASKAETFLETQTRLLTVQTEHLHEQRELILSRLRWGRFSDRMKAALQLMTGLVGIVAVLVLALMAWNASQSNGLLIERFSVPPDLAQRGLTGEVVAAKLLDHLAAMQAQTSPTRPPKTYAQNWNEKDIKLAIPETGVSLGELETFLREKLGHDTHVTGEIVREASGLSLTARAGDYGAESVAGPEAEIDALVQRLSEAVYKLTQPYRYASYLAAHGRQPEAVAIFKALALSGPASERPWGYFGWSGLTMDSDGFESLRQLGWALQLEPDNLLVLRTIGAIEDVNSRPQAALRDFRKLLSLLSSNNQGLLHTAGTQAFAQAGVAGLTGDFQEAIRLSGNGLPADLARQHVGAHQVAAARATMVQAQAPTLDTIPGAITMEIIFVRMLIDLEAQDWRAVLADNDAVGPLLRRYPGLRSFQPSMLMPLLAQAQAGLGHWRAAETLVASTPAACNRCLLARARIAELQGQHGRADFWFARAVTDALSIPFANADWGRALLARGQSDAAIAQFEAAHGKGPHFADPLELWGEALMAKNQSHLALAKFADAEKYAPNWGRLHLKWGEALIYAGKPQDAKKQFAAAGGLDLTPPERAELARMVGHDG